MMRDMGYADGYIYPHDYPQHFAPQDYMPRESQGMRFWVPADNSGEARAAQRMESFWGKKKG
jgi:putative ATPase